MTAHQSACLFATSLSNPLVCWSSQNLISCSSVYSLATYLPFQNINFLHPIILIHAVQHDPTIMIYLFALLTSTHVGASQRSIKHPPHYSHCSLLKYIFIFKVSHFSYIKRLVYLPCAGNSPSLLGEVLTPSTSSMQYRGRLLYLLPI